MAQAKTFVALDVHVSTAFNEVADLLAPPQSIMRPRVLWRVVRGLRSRAEASPAHSLQRSRSSTR